MIVGRLRAEVIGYARRRQDLGDNSGTGEVGRQILAVGAEGFHDHVRIANSVAGPHAEIGRPDVVVLDAELADQLLGQPSCETPVIAASR